ncbi:kinase-like domain-containing protein, partial [Phlebopus sp. FC_14]
QSLRRELGIWKRLDHPNIVPFLGTAFGFGPHTSLISVWMCNGTLQSFLEVRGSSLTITDRFHLASFLHSVLAALHAFPMIHGDLTSNNILIDEHSRARLVDFGFASVIGDLPDGLEYLQRSTQRPGTTRWAAPERFKVDDFRPTTKSDIYSLGCIMLQVLTGRVPWSEIKDSMMVALQLLRGENPARPPSPVIEDEHWTLIEQCW